QRHTPTSGSVEHPLPVVERYIRSFAAEYDLYSHIQFNTLIKSIEQDGDEWIVQPQGEDAQRFRWLVCASGTNWFPNRPTLRGEDHFTGEIIHSVDYDDSEKLRDKRVLVVGAGNSGVDIACDAAFAAASAHLSLRRGYHFVPKHLFGLPADVFAKKTGGGPMWLEQAIFSFMLRVLNGDLTKLGLQKPDHKVLSSHPILNTQVLHYLQHGDLKAHQDINYLDGNTVHFVDGSSIEADLIILATGYNWHLPYMPDEVFEWHNDRPSLYLNIFSPKQSSLFVNGFIETNSGAYHLFDDAAYLIGKTIEAQYNQSAQAVEINETIQGTTPNLSGKLKLVESARHTNYVNGETFVKEVGRFQKKFGWAPVADLLNEPMAVAAD
ncbi:MAG: NAD(P)-binding domain-containing protein, partial [Chloroflexota bacterium]